MTIFDAQVHVESGLSKYDLDVAGWNFIFNSLESYRKNRDRFVKETDSVTIVLEFRKELAFVRGEIDVGRAGALKIHSRIQKIREPEYVVLAEKLASFPSHVPVAIDAFYYGTELEFQPTSHRTDLVKLVRHTDKSRICFGTDYPDASPGRRCFFSGLILGMLGLIGLSVGKNLQETRARPHFVILERKNLET